MKKYFALLGLVLSTLALGDVSVPSGSKDVFNNQNLNRTGLYKVGDVYLGDDDTNTMLIAAPANLSGDAVQFIFPGSNGSANQCLATDGSGNASWIDVIRPGQASIVNADVNASAGITYGKLNLSSSIVTGDVVDGTLLDADINASAAIARSKIANGTADHVVINSGAGALSSEAQLAATRGGTGVSSTATFPTSGTVTTNDATATIQNKTLDTTNTIRAQDTLFEIWDDLDPSKRVKFNVTNLTTATTRTFGVPNANVDLLGTTSSQTVTNKTFDASLNTVTNVNLVTDITGTLGTSNGGTGVSGTAVFPSSGTVTTNAGTQTLTNKDISSATNTYRDASASQSGVVTTSSQTFAGAKTFNDNMDIGTDAAAAAMGLDIRSGSAQRSEINLYQNGTAKVTIATANGNNDLTSGTTAGDLVIRSQNSSDIFFTADGGSTTHARINTDGSQAYGATNAKVTVGGYAYASAWIGAGADQTAGTCAPNCAVTADYGGMISTVTRSGAGTYTINFTASYWSAGPICQANSSRGSSHICVVNASGLSTSSYGVSCFTDAGAATDTRFTITCHGPR